MAQDFYAAFGLGESEKHIGTIDADGVALAAIQGLYQIVLEKHCELEELRDEKDALSRHNRDLEVRLAAIEAQVARLLDSGKGSAR